MYCVASDRVIMSLIAYSALIVLLFDLNNLHSHWLPVSTRVTQFCGSNQRLEGGGTSDHGEFYISELDFVRIYVSRATATTTTLSNQLDRGES